VLVGTQMIAKGHDFPGVTLVGVLNADTGLHRPDFRAAEHTFEVLTQVAGRAGRADKAGEVLVQTYNPEHYAIVAASRHDYQSFYAKELESRREAEYPPFVRLVRVVASAEEEAVAREALQALTGVLDAMGMKGREAATHYVGPAPAPLRKLRGRYRYSILIKGQPEGLEARVAEALQRTTWDKRVALTVDVDPVDMM
jgi:primosomal protein N' (replication factor Y) (superfamily II helicase)